MVVNSEDTNFVEVARYDENGNKLQTIGHKYFVFEQRFEGETYNDVRAIVRDRINETKRIAETPIKPKKTFTERLRNDCGILGTIAFYVGGFFLGVIGLIVMVLAYELPLVLLALALEFVVKFFGWE